MLWKSNIAAPDLKNKERKYSTAHQKQEKQKQRREVGDHAIYDAMVFYSTSCNTWPTMKNGLLSKMKHPRAPKPTTHPFCNAMQLQWVTIKYHRTRKEYKSGRKTGFLPQVSPSIPFLPDLLQPSYTSTLPICHKQHLELISQ